MSRLTLGPINTLIFDGDAAHINEGAGMIDKYVFTKRDMLSEIGVEGWKYS